MVAVALLMLRSAVFSVLVRSVAGIRQGMFPRMRSGFCAADNGAERNHPAYEDIDGLSRKHIQ